MTVLKLAFKSLWGASLSSANVLKARSKISLTSVFSPLNTHPIKNMNRFATLNQIKRGAIKPNNKRVSKAPDLNQCPIKKGVVLRVMVLKPKKPNSALRKACRVRLSNGRVVSAYIGGEGHNAQEHSVVYVRGGRCQDLPGVKYHTVRGAMDLSGVANRVTSRSKYGVKKPAKAE